MKKVLKLILIAVICFVFAGCNKKGEVTVVRYEVNPSIEIILNEEGKVEAVTALNEEGSIVLSGETFIGLSVDDATALYIEICVNMGYLSKGDSASNNIQIYVSGDTSYTDSIEKKIVKSAEKAIEDLGIEANLKEIINLANDFMDTDLVNMGYDEQDIAKMSFDDKVKLLLKERVATAALITNELRDAYYNALKCQLTFTYYVIFNQYINLIDDYAQPFFATFKSMYEQRGSEYVVASNALVDTFFSYFIGLDSAYQIALNAELDAKASLLVAKEELANLDKESEEYQEKLEEIEAKEEALEACIQATSEAYLFAKSMVDAAKTLFNTASRAFKSAYDSIVVALQDQQAKSEMNAKIEESNDEKHESYARLFIAQYSSFITATADAKLEYKQKTMEEIASATN